MEKEMTQRQVKDECDMEQTVYSRIESGGENTNALRIQKISNALGIPLRKFFDLTNYVHNPRYFRNALLFGSRPRKLLTSFKASLLPPLDKTSFR